nr:hypothetical protein B0A51_00119 [Rachicladosporium sp. CCFEE 5018]
MGNLLSTLRPLFPKRVEDPNLLYANSNWVDDLDAPHHVNNDPINGDFVPDGDVPAINYTWYLSSNNAAPSTATVISTANNSPITILPTEVLRIILSPMITLNITTTPAWQTLLDNGLYEIQEDHSTEVRRVNHIVSIAPSSNLRRVAMALFFEKTAHACFIDSTSTGVHLRCDFVETTIFRTHGRHLRVMLVIADATVIVAAVAKLGDIMVECEMLEVTVLELHNSSGLDCQGRKELRQEIADMLNANEEELCGTVELDNF